MKKPFKVRTLLGLIGEIATIYVGLGWLGVVGGFTNTDTVQSKIGGALFLLSGLASMTRYFKKQDADLHD